MDYFTNTESSQDFGADSEKDGEKNGEKTIVKIEQNGAARDESGTCDEGAALISDNLCDDCRAHYEQVKAYLDAAGISPNFPYSRYYDEYNDDFEAWYGSNISF